MRYGFELRIIELVVGPDLDKSALVASAIAVMRGGKDSDAATIMLDLITFHTNFMASNDSFESVGFAESFGDIGTKLKTNSALTRSTSRHCLRIRPEHFHHETRLTGLALLESVQFSNIIKTDCVIREQSTMQNKVFLANESGKG